MYLAGPVNGHSRIHGARFTGFEISLVGFAMVYGVLGQQTACTVCIVIFHNGMTITHVLSQVLLLSCLTRPMS